MKPFAALTATAAALAASALAAPSPQLLSNLLPILKEPETDRFEFYPLKTPLQGPCDMTTGPDGAIWVQDIILNKITRVDPDTGATLELDIPYHDHVGKNFTLTDLLPNQIALACVIQPGDDGLLYAASGIRGQFVRINPTTHEIKVYDVPVPIGLLSNLENFNDMWRAPEGMYFTLTTANSLFLFDYQTEQFTEYPVPRPLAGPLGVYLASDNNIWVCYFLANKIAKFDRNTHKFTEYDLPLRDLGPAVVRAESPKGRIWFTGLLGQSMGSIDIHTGEVRVVPDNALPPGFPTEDTVDCDGNVWYSTLGRNTLNKINVTSGQVEYYKQPGINPLALTIAAHYGPKNSIWYTETVNNRVGRFQLDGPGCKDSSYLGPHD